jgi:hypothetical protein
MFTICRLDPAVFHMHVENDKTAVTLSASWLNLSFDMQLGSAGLVRIKKGLHNRRLRQCGFNPTVTLKYAALAFLFHPLRIVRLVLEVKTKGGVYGESNNLHG